MKERLLKVDLQNMTATEEPAPPTTGHFAAPESPALLFSDGTTVRVTKDSEGNLILRVTETIQTQ